MPKFVKRTAPNPVVEIRDPSKPYWSTTDGTTARIYLGHVMDRLREIPDESVHCVVTSPPYWGLRKYLPKGHEDSSKEIGLEKFHDCVGWARGYNCAVTDFDNGCHVCKMTLVLREVRRVLRDDGTLWLNYGDSYSSGSKNNKSLDLQQDYIPVERPTREFSNGRVEVGSDWSGKSLTSWTHRDATVKQGSSLSSGNLMGVPWRVALSLQADGWVLRQEIIWKKASPQPESMRNRCTKAHEQIFLLTKKGSGYYYDATAIREKSITAGTTSKTMEPDDEDTEVGKDRNKWSVWTVEDDQRVLGWLRDRYPDVLDTFLQESGNKGDVWRVASGGFSGGHFATFGERLILPCVLAGTSAHGCCGKCGTPWNRVTEQRKLRRERPNDLVKRTGEEGTGNFCPNTVAGTEVRTLGWEPGCECFGARVGRIVDKMPSMARDRTREEGLPDGVIPRGSRSMDGKSYAEHVATAEPIEDDGWGYRAYDDLPLSEHPVVPCTVMDPFLGSGTTVAVANKHGRRGVGIEVNQKYVDDYAVERISAMLLEMGLPHLVRSDEPVAITAEPLRMG